MRTAFSAIVTRDGIRWLGEVPASVKSGGSVVAELHVEEAPAELPGPGWSGADLVELLDRIADADTFGAMDDPVDWQRDVRGTDEA